MPCNKQSKCSEMCFSERLLKIVQEFMKIQRRESCVCTLIFFLGGAQKKHIPIILAGELDVSSISLGKLVWKARTHHLQEQGKGGTHHPCCGWGAMWTFLGAVWALLISPVGRGPYCALCFCSSSISDKAGWYLSWLLISWGKRNFTHLLYFKAEPVECRNSWWQRSKDVIEEAKSSRWVCLGHLYMSLPLSVVMRYVQHCGKGMSLPQL